MATYILQPGQDILTGTEDTDEFFANNNSLNAGDRLNGLGGYDAFFYSADAAFVPQGGQAVGRFAAFQLINIESFEVTNDSLVALEFDLSSTLSTSGLVELAVSNGSNAVFFDQVTTPANIRLTNLTQVAAADLRVAYQNQALAADSTIGLVLDNTSADQLILGSVGDANGGIDRIELTTIGSSTINSLNTDLSTLTIDGTGNVTIQNALNTTVDTIISTSTGNVTLSFANNVTDVAYTGGSGIDTVTAGAGDDTIETNAGNDRINAGGGDDLVLSGEGDDTVDTGTGTNTVISGAGNDVVFANGEFDTITTDAGNDIIDARNQGGIDRLTVSMGDGDDRVIFGSTFDASVGANTDSLDFGSGNDVVEINAGATDALFLKATSLEGVSLLTAGTTVLQDRAQDAGVNSIQLRSGGDDVVDASSFDAPVQGGGITVYSFGFTAPSTQQGVQAYVNYNNVTDFGNDTARTGDGSDLFLFRGDNNLTDADVLVAGDGYDRLVLEGDTTIVNGQFSGFETLTLESNRNGAFADNGGSNRYDIRLTNANAPTAGVNANNFFFIYGNALGGVSAVYGREDARIDVSNVTAFRSDITTGAGYDTVISGNTADVITTQAGNDDVVAGAGNDVIDTGEGDDRAVLVSGNNRLTDISGTNRIYLGTGNDTVLVGGGQDNVYSGTGTVTVDGIVYNVGDLTAGDTLTDGFGNTTDTLWLGGRAYTDGNFTNVSGFEIIDLALNNAGGANLQIGQQAQEAGVIRVNDSDAADFIDARDYTVGLIVDLEGGADDVALLGSGADLVYAGTGDQTINGQNGNDIVRVEDNEWQAADAFNGGIGTDTLQLDNTLGGVNATVDLSNVTNVENFIVFTTGDRGPGVDQDNSVLRFQDGGTNTVTTETTINVIASNILDSDDTFRVVLDTLLRDADFNFTITGSDSATTIVTKQNFGVNNDITFNGGDVVDILEIQGSDLGSTTIFNGGGGRDIIRQINASSAITDDSFRRVFEVEVLSATTRINATLGAAASRSGLDEIIGAGDDFVRLSQAFVTAGEENLRITLNGGNDTILASAAPGAITVFADDAELDTNDILEAGTSADDTLEIAATGGAADLTTTSGFEIINITGDNDSTLSTTTALTLDATRGEVNGGTVTITVSGDTNAGDAFTLNAGAATADLVVSAGDGDNDITTGSGDDDVTVGDGDNTVELGNGANTVVTGDGDNDITSGTGVDSITTGSGDDVIDAGANSDTVNAGAGEDAIRGGAGTDTINGGSGNDAIQGGLGNDILNGGTGSDVFFYETRAESSGPQGRDIINGFQSGVDFVNGAEAALAANGGAYGANAVIRFAGNQANFGDAQSAIFANDGILDVVYQRNDNLLWFDLNDNGALDNNDLQIQVFLADGATGITGNDVFAGLTVGQAAAQFAAFEGVF